MYKRQGSDPAAVIYDSIQAAKARNIDILICDTAGRLHNKKNLMNELAKINKVIGSEYPDENRCTLLVLDATTGQNAISQAKLFRDCLLYTSPHPGHKTLVQKQRFDPGAGPRLKQF